MQNLITGIIAPKGSGKSHKAAEIMGTLSRAAVFNIVRKDVAYLGCATHIFDGEPRAFAEALGEEEFRIVYRPVKVEINEKGGPEFPEFPMFVETCFYRGSMAMIIDEAHLLCDPWHIPPTLTEALVLGRHEELDIIYVSQGFSMVSRMLTRNTDQFFFWRIIEPSDLNGIRERCGPDVADTVANLRRLEDHRREGGALTPGEMLRWTVWGGTE